MAHGVGGLFLVSDALRSSVFDLLRRIASIAYDYQTQCQKKIVRVPVGKTHTHLRRSRNASAPVSVLCSKLEDNDPIMLGLIQLGADTCRVSDPDFRGAALGCWGWVAW